MAALQKVIVNVWSMTRERICVKNLFVFSFFWQNDHLFLKMVAPSKKVIALNLYIGINIFMYERWLAVNIWYTVGCQAALLSDTIS